MRHGRRTTTFGIVVIVFSLLLAGAPVAEAAPPPTLRLFAATSTLEAPRQRDGLVWVDPGAWVASVGGAFELIVSRPDYLTPVSIRQVDAATGSELRTLPAELLEGWSGLRDFLHVSVRDGRGRLVLRQALPFCPNGYSRARLSDDGPMTSSYPYFCGGNPFTRGMVWGIDDHWAVNVLADYGLVFEAPQRRYRIRVWVDPAWMEALGIAAEDAEAVVSLKVTDRGGGGVGPGPIDLRSLDGPATAVPIVESPDPRGLPDLIALPAWGMSTYHRKGRDFLGFSATEWNAGPGTLVVEGFRGPNQNLMDAYQYFLVDGRPVGRALIGQLEFHGSHQHWHFQQFTEYSILDADSGQIAKSGKQSWCLANTDAIDLAVPNANWGAFGGDLFTMCGGPGALWIREILDVGWGDTYSQFVPGQAFDITDLPNGDYFVRVHVNPTGSMLEGSMDNNVEDRLIRLRGRPGARRVIVPPWNGIDTEGGCYFCA
jgi:hypothetical protein